MKIVTGLIALLGLLGTTSIAVADPENSQRLRGLGDRSFAVWVTDLSDPGNPFNNCYTFNADGSWDDPLFPVLGTWTQDSTGAATGYTATAVLPVGVDVAVRLTQEGSITPARGRGMLQLDAHNIVDLIDTTDPEDPVQILIIAELTSVGSQDDTCAD